MKRLFLVMTLLLPPIASYPVLGLAADAGTVIDDCESCHGESGASSNEEYPIIGGVSEFYLDEALRTYRDDARPCTETEYPSGPKKGEKTDMCKVAGGLDDDTIAEVAAWFAQQPFIPAEQPFDAAKAEMGAKVHDRYCEKCHSAGGSEPFDDSGILAGQWRHYLEDTFQQIDSGAREQPEKMMLKYNELNTEEKEALLHYYASGGGR